MIFAEAVKKMVENGYKTRCKDWDKNDYLEYVDGKFKYYNSKYNIKKDTDLYIDINYDNWEIFKSKARCIDCMHINEIGISIRNVTKNKRTITSHCEKKRAEYFETFKKRYCDKFEESKYKIDLF